MGCISRCPLGPYRNGLVSLPPVYPSHIVSSSTLLPGLHPSHLNKSHLTGTCFHLVLSLLSSTAHIHTSSQCLGSYLLTILLHSALTVFNYMSGVRTPQGYIHLFASSPTTYATALLTYLHQGRCIQVTGLCCLHHRLHSPLLMLLALFSSQPHHTINHLSSDITLGALSFPTLMNVPSSAQPAEKLSGASFGYSHRVVCSAQTAQKLFGARFGYTQCVVCAGSHILIIVLCKCCSLVVLLSNIIMFTVLLCTFHGWYINTLVC